MVKPREEQISRETARNNDYYQHYDGKIIISSRNICEAKEFGTQKKKKNKMN
jgi:hypothetical protein